MEKDNTFVNIYTTFIGCQCDCVSNFISSNADGNMNILVTNDDGVAAPGLLALAQAMRPFGNIKILALTEIGPAAGMSKHWIVRYA